MRKTASILLLGLLISGVFALAQNEGNTLTNFDSLHLIVRKKARRLEVFENEKLVKTYRVALGFAPAGDKESEGDGRTPEGDFYVFTKNERSRFYLSLGLSYPNAAAAERGLREKIISQSEHDEILRAIAEKRKPPQKTALGGEIYIHGTGAASRAKGDWTRGCIALSDEEIEELFAVVPVGARVSIVP